MDITWHGNSCFQLKNKEVTLLINPDKETGKLKADGVLSSLPETMEIDGVERVFDWPGEYEYKNVPINAFQAWTAAKDDKAAEETIIFSFKMDGIKICHLGALGHELTDEMINKIGDVDILMMNGSPDSNLGTKKASEVIEAIEPRAIAFYGTEDPTAILKELGAGEVESQDKVSLSGASALPDDKRAYFVFNKA